MPVWWFSHCQSEKFSLSPLSRWPANRPAIRSLEIGRHLQDEFSVTVFSPIPSAEQPASGNLNIVTGGGRNRLYNLSEQANVLFIQANVLKAFPALTRSGKYLAVDLYDPYLLSLLEQYNDDPVTADSSFRFMHQVLERHMLAADFAVCASERQRDYWLGRYCALGRLAPSLYKFDRSLRKLIDVVPFGVQETPPVKRRAASKEWFRASTETISCCSGAAASGTGSIR